MTAEEYSRNATEDEVIEFYRQFRGTGFLDPEPDRRTMEKACEVFGFCRETFEKRHIHSRDDDFIYQHRWTASELSDKIENALLMAAGTLRMQGFGPLSTHEWSDGSSFVAALAEQIKPGCKYERIIAVTSFCNMDGDHFDLFAPTLRDKFAEELILWTSKDVARFESYGQHDLSAFLWTCGYNDWVDEEGYCIPMHESRPAVPGNILFCADYRGMCILSSL